jgi:hypothetical protein
MAIRILDFTTTLATAVARTRLRVNLSAQCPACPKLDMARRLAKQIKRHSLPPLQYLRMIENRLVTSESIFMDMNCRHVGQAWALCKVFVPLIWQVSLTSLKLISAACTLLGARHAARRGYLRRDRPTASASPSRPTVTVEAFANKTPLVLRPELGESRQIPKGAMCRLCCKSRHMASVK